MTRLAVVGATGLVGRKMLDVLAERDFQFTSIHVLASPSSAGKKVMMGEHKRTVEALSEAWIQANPVDVALFSAGGDTAQKFAPLFTQAGATVIDNSSAFRMQDDVPLVVPEVNPQALDSHKGIIANPNCSTIQMVVALKPVHERFGVTRVVVSTYQSVTGSGMDGIDQLDAEAERREINNPAYPHPIHRNAIPHIDDFREDGFTKEEWKMVVETQKILDPAIEVLPTTVRIPTTGGHAESLYVETENAVDLDQIRKAWDLFPGITVIDEPTANRYPMPLYAQDRDDVFVGRLRKDPMRDNAFLCWVVSDNLRKGAATNAVQILELLTAGASENTNG